MSSELSGERVKIIMDNRELKSHAAKALFEKDGVELSQEQLLVGDYILSEDVIVERKTESDLISSILDGRLFAQIEHLSHSCKKPVVIVEGRGDLYSSGIHPNAIRGALASISIDFRIPVLWAEDGDDTANYLEVVARREQLGLNKPVVVRAGKKPVSTKERQEYLVCGLPNVGSTLAKNLLKEFGCVQGVFTASREDLLKVPKVGGKKADLIRDVLSQIYESKD